MTIRAILFLGIAANVEGSSISLIQRKAGGLITPLLGITARERMSAKPPLGS